MKPLLFCLVMLCGWTSQSCFSQELKKQATTKTGTRPARPPAAFPSALTDAAEPGSMGSTAGPTKPTIKLKHEGRTFVGQPLAWNGKQLAMLRLDGELKLIPMKDKKSASVVSPKFDPYNPSELKSRLKREFGDRYDISTTKNCVVVHPWGKAEYWAEPFEVMIRRFETYFAKQKVELTKSEFTFIVIVLRSRKDFDRYMHNEIKLHNGNVAGFYSRLSNRMVTYDPSGRVRKPGQKSWLLGSHTMFHESAHQLAFNRGIHNRFSPPPLWLSEGLAMLFETSGTNKRRRDALRKLYSERKVTGQVYRLITDDTLFQSDPELAYSLAWGMANYLSVKNPNAFFKYLDSDGERPNFHFLPPSKRLKMFAEHFGSDIDQIEEGMQQYYR